jgi:hypothetical protein
MSIPSGSKPRRGRTGEGKIEVKSEEGTGKKQRTLTGQATGYNTGVAAAFRTGALPQRAAIQGQNKALEDALAQCPDFNDSAEVREAAAKFVEAARRLVHYKIDLYAILGVLALGRATSYNPSPSATRVGDWALSQITYGLRSPTDPRAVQKPSMLWHIVATQCRDLGTWTTVLTSMGNPDQAFGRVLPTNMEQKKFDVKNYQGDWPEANVARSRLCSPETRAQALAEFQALIPVIADLSTAEKAFNVIRYMQLTGMLPGMISKSSHYSGWDVRLKPGKYIAKPTLAYYILSQFCDPKDLRKIRVFLTRLSSGEARDRFTQNTGAPFPTLR